MPPCIGLRGSSGIWKLKRRARFEWSSHDANEASKYKRVRVGTDSQRGTHPQVFMMIDYPLPQQYESYKGCGTLFIDILLIFN